MTTVPGAPGAPAVRLFTEVFTDDIEGFEHRYIRIKVLTNEGRSQGNIEIPFVKESADIKDLRARVVRPDGSSADFSGVPLEKEIIRARGFRYLAKVITLFDVQVGSIIEYQYDLRWDRRFVYFDPWIVPGDLITVRASFTRRRTGVMNLRYYTSRLPLGSNVQVGSDGLIRLELKDVAASQSEDFMPPEAETRPRVDFYYYFGPTEGSDLEKTWKQTAKLSRGSIDHYVSKDHGLDRFLNEAVGPDDSPETRLRKLYKKVQALRNPNYESEKTRQEDKREKIKPSEYVEDVVKHGYGGRYELDLLLFALVRRGGFDATLLALAQRDGATFFDHRAMSLSSLPGRAVLVNLNGHDYFLDPGTPLLPFGSLRWGETSVKALRLDLENGVFIVTPDTVAADSSVDRNATLTLSETGSLEGLVTVTYSGLEAFNRRFDARDMDEVARRHTLETELQQWVPSTAEVQLRNQPDWSSTEQPLTAELSVHIPTWTTIAGHRLLCPEGIFSGGERDLFQLGERTHDLYFHFLSETRDRISISLPPNLRVDTLPAELSRDLGFLSYNTVASTENNTLHFTRRVTLKSISLRVGVYAGVRAFYQSLRVADDAQAVLVPQATPATD